MGLFHQALFTIYSAIVFENGTDGQERLEFRDHVRIIQYGYSDNHSLSNGGFQGLWTNDLLAQLDKHRAEMNSHDTAMLHRQVDTEVRDEAWAKPTEADLEVKLQQFHPTDVESYLFITKCKRIL